MKKIILLLLCVLIAVSLSGCAQLDELKEKCAYWADETHNKINYNGTYYVKVDYAQSDELNWYEFTDYNYISLAENDVPLLLVGIYGSDYYYSCALKNRDNRLLIVGTYGQKAEIYCREDCIEDFIASPPERRFTDIKITYKCEACELSEADSARLLEWLNEEPIVVISDDNTDYEPLHISACDSYGLYRVDGYLYSSTDGKYYLVDSNTYYIYDDVYGYEVPDDIRNILMDIMTYGFFG